MRRADRLFEIIQILRSEAKPVTADRLAVRLEVSSRTIYRDIAALQAMRTPIEGEAGIGYVMRSGYDLPPLNFDTDELEAIVVGLGLLSRTGDVGLKRAAERIAMKIEALRSIAPALHVSSWGAPEPDQVDPSRLRAAIRDTRKLALSYRDGAGDETVRIVCPLGMVYHVQAAVLVAWCQLRRDIRHFRIDRILACQELDDSFADDAERFYAAWDAQSQARDQQRPRR
ncbi:MAG: YafY family protein [Pseudomonadota bacterium]